MQNHEEVQDARRRRMFSALFNDAPLGSLWIVLEEIWKERIPGYDQNSTRHDHPGCSIRRAGLTIEPIAMLHGTSQRHGGRGVCVSNVKGDSGETYFGYTPPVTFSLEDWFVARSVTPAFKGRLDENEERELKTKCRERGWGHV